MRAAVTLFTAVSGHVAQPCAGADHGRRAFSKVPYVLSVQGPIPVLGGVDEDVSMTLRQIRRLSIGPLALLGLLGLSACVTTISSRPVMLPDGHLGYDVRCNGVRNDIGDCMNEAARVCSGQYHVATQINDVRGSGAATPAPAGNGGGAVILRGSQRTMIVECGPPPPSEIPVRWLKPSSAFIAASTSEPRV